MGAFITECSNLENMLISMIIFTNASKSFEEVYLEMLDKTFGARIREFKKAAALYDFSAEQRVSLDEIFADLDSILPKRNFIVHGTTMEMGVGDGPIVAYRVGAPKGNIHYLNEVISSTGQAAHVFTAERIRQVTTECMNIAGRLGPILNFMVNKLVERP
ncbi:hypothetical protein C2U70_20370 [Bradyrhizobium guangdongense]|nr:hypothetical protein C2U70_20370 [Bradyrhizobium guangdongense]